MKVLVDKKDLKNIKRNYLEKGLEGTCYLLPNDNRVVKIFHECDESKNIYFTDLCNNQIAFPIDVLYSENNKLIGYTMNYLKGEKFISGFREDLDLRKLKEVYFKTRILMLKLKDLYMDDNCLENMLYDYDNNLINLIDTSRWYIKESGELESINEFNWQMITALIRNIDWKHYKLNQDKELFELHMTYEYLENTPSLFLEFLNKLEEKVSEYKGYKVKTIKDLIIK